MMFVRATTALVISTFFSTPGAYASEAVPPARLQNPLAAISLDELSATRDRPLFVPSRRPPPPVSVVQSAPPPLGPPDPPNLTLIAIILDGHQRAIVQEGTGPISRLQTGDNIDGWRIARIEKQRIEIAHDSRTVSITMFRDNQPK